ncbi:uncharacterized protein LOC124452100 [Xenia sp. Carnegie-2017]|uniref:uncharacterized protein LOC124452100 n=1 Tax=Xenia sp. Carnegie-2017 TaxID=2897299 RepID=UPI001F036610|nr:uncharacterized protein LOC124452100 [Xenia sp. Carnegie-2017]
MSDYTHQEEVPLEKVVILVNNREEDMFPDKEISSIFDRNVFGTENCSFEVNPVDQEINVAKTTQNISVFVGERSQRNVFSSFEQTGDGSYRNQTSEIEPYHQGEPDFQAMQLDDSLLVNNREEDLFPDEEISSIFDRNVFGTENCSFEVNPVDQEINVAKTTQNISVFVGERSQRNVFSSLEQTGDRSYRNQTSEIKPYHQGETDYEAMQLGDSLLVRKREEDLFPDEEISLIIDRNVFGTEICSFEGNPVDQEINVAKTTQNISVFVGERSQRNVFSSFEQTGDGSYRNQTSEIEPYHQGEPDFQAMQLDDSLLVNNREEDLFPDEEISSIFDRNVFGTENCSFEVNPVNQEINVAKTTQNNSVFVGERSQRNVFSSLEQTGDGSYRNQTSEIKPYHQREPDYEAMQLGDSLLVRKREEDLFPDEEISLIFDRNVFGTEICSFEGIQWIKK